MKDMKVMVLQTNGSIEEFRTEWSLKMAQEIVGGLIEAVSLTGATMYINEEGKILGLPANDLATQIWHDDLYKRGCAVGWDVIVGDVLIVGDTDARSDRRRKPASVRHRAPEDMTKDEYDSVRFEAMTENPYARCTCMNQRNDDGICSHCEWEEEKAETNKGEDDE